VENVAARVQEHLSAGADHVALYVLRGRSGKVPMQEWRELAAIV
jgi:hypothetical protein